MGLLPTRPRPGSHLSHAEGACGCPFNSLGGLRLVSLPPPQLSAMASWQVFVQTSTGTRLRVLLPISGEPGLLVPQRVPQSSCAPAHVASVPWKLYQKFERFQFILLSRTWLSLRPAAVPGCPTASTSGPQPGALKP